MSENIIFALVLYIIYNIGTFYSLPLQASRINADFVA